MVKDAMLKISFLIAALLIQTCLSHAQGCKFGVTIVDKQNYEETAAKIVEILSDRYSDFLSNDPTIDLYQSSEDSVKFAEEVYESNPDILVMHFSTFGPGTGLGQKERKSFVKALERLINQNADRPSVYYAVYSSSFGSDYWNDDSRFFGAEGGFIGVNHDRVARIPVPYGGRFAAGHGDTELQSIVDEYLETKGCK